jgi:hypothetical protein
MAGLASRRPREFGRREISGGENEEPKNISERTRKAGRPSRYYCVHFSTFSLQDNQEITRDSYGAILNLAARLDKAQAGQFVKYDAVIWGPPGCS